MIIREAKENDVCEILSLIENSYIPYSDQIEESKRLHFDEKEILDLIQGEDSKVWVGEENEHLTGVVAGMSLSKETYHLKLMFGEMRRIYQPLRSRFK